MSETITSGLTLAWGNPGQYVRNLTQNGPWKKLPDCVEGSVQTTPTKGEKVEANTEEGIPEALRYKKSKYAHEYSIREAAEREMVIDHDDGVVTDIYGFILVPEDPNAKGFYMEKSAVSVEDSGNAADGVIYKYTHDALKPTSGKAIKRGVIKVTETTGVFTFQAKGKDFGSANAFVNIGTISGGGSSSGSGSGSGGGTSS